MIPGIHRRKGGAALVGIRPGDDVPGPFGLCGTDEDDETAADVQKPTAAAEPAAMRASR